MNIKIVHSQQTRIHGQKLIVILIVLLNLSLKLFSQGISINTSGIPADNSAILDVSSTSQGLLIPRMTTTHRDNIASPATSLLIFNTTTNCFEAYVNASWYSVSCPPPCTPPTAPTAGSITSSQTNIAWNWNTVSTASGYKLNTENNYATATDNGTGNSYIQAGLNCNTPYSLYVWAYNGCGNSSVSALPPASTSVCGPSCGGQTWAAANLNAGTQVPVHNEQTVQGEKWCYNDVSSNCSSYGALYEWASVVNLPYVDNTTLVGGAWQTCNPCGNNGIQGICPVGYHIPTDLEWSQYEYCVENNIAPKGSTSLSTFQNTNMWRGSNTAGVGPGDKLKASSANSPSWDGTNASGFAAMPAGWTYSGGCNNINLNAIFWTATENGASAAWNHALYSGNPRSWRYEGDNKTYGFSERCLQN
jgi:uncharacterized protein (TIGR02145 family)